MVKSSGDGAPPPRIGWRPEYSVGNAEIDGQHQQLFQLCQEMYGLAGDPSREAHERFHELIDQLVRYVKTHFHCEQFFMEVNGYPDYAEHYQEHQKILLDLSELLVSVVSGQSGCVECADFVAGWIRDHILQSDMKLKSITGKQ